MKRRWILFSAFLLALILAGVIFVIDKSVHRPAITITTAVASDISNQLTSDKININDATAAELETLPGIGPEKAKSIVDFRENNGKFRSIEDLLYVPGIGNAIFERIKVRITV